MSDHKMKIGWKATTAVLSTDGTPVKVLSAQHAVPEAVEKYLDSDPECTQLIVYIDFFDYEGNPVGMAERDLDAWTYTYKGP